LDRAVDRILLHVFRHICILYDSFSFRHLKNTTPLATSINKIHINFATTRHHLCKLFWQRNVIFCKYTLPLFLLNNQTWNQSYFRDKNLLQTKT
jgi:hypothetical protein